MKKKKLHEGMGEGGGEGRGGGQSDPIAMKLGMYNRCPVYSN